MVKVPVKKIIKETIKPVSKPRQINLNFVKMVRIKKISKDMKSLKAEINGLIIKRENLSNQLKQLEESISKYNPANLYTGKEKTKYNSDLKNKLRLEKEIDDVTKKELRTKRDVYVKDYNILKATEKGASDPVRKEILEIILEHGFEKAFEEANIAELKKIKERLN
ncbi:MAG: hypothetical protein V1824_00480 [archaeon]